MSLFSSSLFSILVNGSPYNTFKPSQGIHQGDPFSPFLFILMDEMMGRTIKAGSQKEILKGLDLHDDAPLTHQQFVDDTLIYHPLVKETNFFKEIL